VGSGLGVAPTLGAAVAGGGVDDGDGDGGTVGSGVVDGGGVPVTELALGEPGGAVAIASVVAVGDGGTTLGATLADAAAVGLGIATEGDAAGLDGTGDALATGTAAAERFCGDGRTWTNQSAALSFVSTPFPAAPPGRRSMLDEAAGAGADAPSTNALAASPQPKASIGVPPTGRRTTAPPVAARPPEYVVSAVDAYAPAALAMSR
jgi:hypothetical protein